MNAFGRYLLAAVVCTSVMSWYLVPGAVTEAFAEPAKDRPSWQQVTQIVNSTLGERKGYQAGDLITRSDAQRVFRSLANANWRPTDQKQILSDTLSDGDVLVRILSSQRGVVFMRKVGSDKLAFDRMDRVSRAPGGQRMLTDIARLPDGEKLAKMRRPHGVPGFLELLPKDSSGKTRTIKDYRKPTGRVYTGEQLLARLKMSYQGSAQSKSKTR